MVLWRPVRRSRKVKLNFWLIKTIPSSSFSPIIPHVSKHSHALHFPAKIVNPKFNLYKHSHRLYFPTEIVKLNFIFNCPHPLHFLQKLWIQVQNFQNTLIILIFLQKMSIQISIIPITPCSSFSCKKCKSKFKLFKTPLFSCFFLQTLWIKTPIFSITPILFIFLL